MYGHVDSANHRETCRYAEVQCNEVIILCHSRLLKYFLGVAVLYLSFFIFLSTFTFIPRHLIIKMYTFTLIHFPEAYSILTTKKKLEEHRLQESRFDESVVWGFQVRLLKNTFALLMCKHSVGG